MYLWENKWRGFSVLVGFWKRGNLLKEKRSFFQVCLGMASSRNYTLVEMSLWCWVKRICLFFLRPKAWSHSKWRFTSSLNSEAFFFLLKYIFALYRFLWINKQSCYLGSSKGIETFPGLCEIGRAWCHDRHRLLLEGSRGRHCCLKSKKRRWNRQSSESLCSQLTHGLLLIKLS